MPNVWKMPLKSQRQPDFVLDKNNRHKFERNKADRAREFCFSEGWTGIGWGLQSIEKNLSDEDEYLSALNSISKDKLPFPFVDANGSCRALSKDMQVGDFVWCRTGKNTYYLGRVSGPWEYHFENPFADFDLYQVRRCRWEIVSPATVPGRVKNAFAGPGMAISCMQKDKDAALFASELIWEIKTGEKSGKGQWAGESILSVLGHDELEDIVGLYLQMQLGWSIVPTTAKFATPHTEFVMRNRAGKCAYVQVKSGKAKLDFKELYLPEGVDLFFVFYPTISEEQNINLDEKIRIIAIDEIERFIQSNKALLPDFVRVLQDSLLTHPPSAPQ